MRIFSEKFRDFQLEALKEDDTQNKRQNALKKKRADQEGWVRRFFSRRVQTLSSRYKLSEKVSVSKKERSKMTQCHPDTFIKGPAFKNVVIE